MKSLNNAKALAALVVATSIAAPAFAQSVDEPISVTVSYGDLDLSHAAGAQALLHRLEYAADKACGGAPDIRVLAQRAIYDKCRTTAVEKAVDQVKSPILTALAQKGPVIRIAHR